MPILETYDASTIDQSLYFDADALLTGEALFRLAAFKAGTALTDAFRCDSGFYSSLRAAACTLTGIEKDRVKEVTQARRGKASKKSGVKAWKDMPKDFSPKANEETRTVKRPSYSPNAIRSGVKTLRESHSVAIKRASTFADGTIGVLIVRTTNPEGTDES